MMNMILQKDNGTTANIINPEGVGIRRYALKSRGLLRNSMIFGNRVKASTWEAQSQDISSQN
jgi:hypothetical protein